jgi:hypothetical protein
MLAMPTGVDEIGDSVTMGTTLEANDSILAHGNVDPAQINEATIAGVVLDDSEAEDLLGASPSDDFNLSTEEFAVFEALGDKHGAGHEGAANAVNATYKLMLAARMQAYADKDLAGIALYDRGGDTARGGCVTRSQPPTVTAPPMWCSNRSISSRDSLTWPHSSLWAQG